jgi:pyridoxamine 5'-phosphate oxidase family protein
MFTDQEIAYLKSQHLARVATVSNDGQPDVTPVGFEFDGEFFYVGGRDMTRTRKYRNIKSGNPLVALVVDDVTSHNPWNPRGIRIYGAADLVERQGYAGPGIYLRIKPEISWSWNIESPQVHKVRHTRAYEKRLV